MRFRLNVKGLKA